ncbi:MAG TPA: helix-turn-helix domain-containing protein, partial [Usitatibacter sp.]|nr:helix-turn-helix domain-containing protein [Usitatibacter sp.]
TSPHQWLLLLRIERAKRMLKGPMPLALVATMCGFVDQSHFTKVFTHIEGMTPGAWRRQLH